MKYSILKIEVLIKSSRETIKTQRAESLKRLMPKERKTIFGNLTKPYLFWKDRAEREAGELFRWKIQLLDQLETRIGYARRLTKEKHLHLTLREIKALGL